MKDLILLLVSVFAFALTALCLDFKAGAALLLILPVAFISFLMFFPPDPADNLPGKYFCLSESRKQQLYCSLPVSMLFFIISIVPSRAFLFAYVFLIGLSQTIVWQTRKKPFIFLKDGLYFPRLAIILPGLNKLIQVDLQGHFLVGIQSKKMLWQISDRRLFLERIAGQKIVENPAKFISRQIQIGYSSDFGYTFFLEDGDLKHRRKNQRTFCFYVPIDIGPAPFGERA